MLIFSALARGSSHLYKSDAWEAQCQKNARRKKPSGFHFPFASRSTRAFPYHPRVSLPPAARSGPSVARRASFNSILDSLSAAITSSSPIALAAHSARSHIRPDESRVHPDLSGWSRSKRSGGVRSRTRRGPEPNLISRSFSPGHPWFDLPGPRTMLLRPVESEAGNCSRKTYQGPRVRMSNSSSLELKGCP